MPSLAARSKLPGLAAAAAGLVLLGYLVERTGRAQLLRGVASAGWGLALVIAVTGLAHIVRTWAWRVTLLEGESSRVSFGRLLGFRLVSEAAGQIGAFGQFFGDALRVSGLGPLLPVSNRITSVVLDRTLFTLSGALVTIAGTIAALFLLPLPHRIWMYLQVFAFSLGALVLLAVVIVRRRWAVLSRPARAVAQLGSLGSWVASKRSIIVSVEEQLLEFCGRAPGRFWGSFLLNLTAHLLAIAEVYLILRLIGVHTNLMGALVIEALTKLVNAVGLVNPGNLGTYEGGNMLLAKVLGFSGTAGLVLALIRRIRSLFWAAVGVVCMVALTKLSRRGNSTEIGHGEEGNVPDTAQLPKQESGGQAECQTYTAVILADGLPTETLLARVGSLPVLLRAIIGAQKAGAARVVVVIDEGRECRVKEELQRSRRLSGSVEWQTFATGDIGPVLRKLAIGKQRAVLIAADRTYYPSLHQQAAGWTQTDAMALTTGEEPAGIYVLAAPAIEIATLCPPGTHSIAEFHEWFTSIAPVTCVPVPGDLWQQILTTEDHRQAESKLDRWLVKPTDGVFARMNRHVSIPISRWLIDYPITPNMVSLFTLGVSFLSGVYFAFGGRWQMFFGAVLSVEASILDGCDGEVARLKLQDSAFGCWLETVCDYLYYVFIFVGMTIGLLKRGPVYVMWSSLLFFGAAVIVLMTTLQRRRLAGRQPEQYLRIWHAQAEKRRSNPFLNLGRHTEVLMRRCCMPYIFLFFAGLGVTHFAFIGAAVGANIAWPIVLYSYFTMQTAKTDTASARTRPTVYASHAEIHG